MLAHNLVFHTHTKHVDLNIHFVLERVILKKLIIQHVPILATRQFDEHLT